MAHRPRHATRAAAFGHPRVIGASHRNKHRVLRRSPASQRWGSLVENTPKAFIQPPERVARAIVACLRRPRTEVWTSLTARLGMGLLSTFPRVADTVLGRFAQLQDRINRVESQTKKSRKGLALVFENQYTDNVVGNAA